MMWLLAQAGTTAVAGENDQYLVWGFLLLGAAAVLLFLELFVPSGGLIGVLAGVASVGSIVAFFKYDTTWGFIATLFYVILGPIIVVFAFKLWMNSPVGRGMILGGNEPGAIDDEEGAISSEHARQERQAQLRQLIGAQGVAVSYLRPVGTVKINGQRIDAMAESGVIEPGTPVVVADVYDNQVKVRAV